MSNWRSSVEKMKRWMVPVESEKRLFCVVCRVARPEGESDHADVLVRRMHNSIYHTGYAVIFLKDFYKLKMMHGVDWNEMHRVIFRHKKKNAYALLYSGDLPRDARNAMNNIDFGTKIFKLVDINYHSFSENADVRILTIKGTKTSGRHLSCNFIDVRHAKSILSSYKMSHGTGGNTVRVEPYPDEV